LARLKLPYPEAVFEINYFSNNPKPCVFYKNDSPYEALICFGFLVFTLAHELYPGKFRPTPTHSFVRLLAEHKLLHTCFTQNIDTLERRAGVPAEKIVEAHGSFADQRCIARGCGARYDAKKYKEKVMKKEIVYCEKCKKGLVKPDIVFFGEGVSEPAYSTSL
jgi:NAD+-dependent protein deacetylase SIR2